MNELVLISYLMHRVHTCIFWGDDIVTIFIAFLAALASSQGNNQSNTHAKSGYMQEICHGPQLFVNVANTSSHQDIYYLIGQYNKEAQPDLRQVDRDA